MLRPLGSTHVFMRGRQNLFLDTVIAAKVKNATMNKEIAAPKSRKTNLSISDSACLDVAVRRSV